MVFSFGFSYQGRYMLAGLRLAKCEIVRTSAAGASSAEVAGAAATPAAATGMAIS